MQTNRILVVEDHDATRRVLTKMLTRRGFDVEEARDGRGALEQVTGCRYDLLISDIGLPDMTGWELLKKFHQHCPEVPAIAVTGYGRPEEVETSVKAGFKTHLTKPVTMAQIEAAIRVTLDQGRSNHAHRFA